MNNRFKNWKKEGKNLFFATTEKMFAIIFINGDKDYQVQVGMRQSNSNGDSFGTYVRNRNTDTDIEVMKEVAEDLAIKLDSITIGE